MNLGNRNDSPFVSSINPTAALTPYSFELDGSEPYLYVPVKWSSLHPEFPKPRKVQTTPEERKLYKFSDVLEVRLESRLFDNMALGLLLFSRCKILWLLHKTRP